MWVLERVFMVKRGRRRRYGSIGMGMSSCTLLLRFRRIDVEVGVSRARYEYTKKEALIILRTEAEE
jgi:hypothetical protein